MTPLPDLEPLKREQAIRAHALDAAIRTHLHSEDATILQQAELFAIYIRNGMESAGPMLAAERAKAEG